MSTKDKETKFSFYNLILFSYRLIILAISTYMYFCYFRAFSWRTFIGIVSFLTQWGNLMNHFYFLLNTFMFVDKQYTKRFSTFFNTVFALNLSVTILFWIVLLPNLPADHFDKFDKVYFNPYMKTSTFMMYYTHTFPFLASLIDFFLNRIQLDGKGLIVWLMVMVCYVTVNAINVFVFKRVVYDIINYVDFMSYVFITAAFALAFFSWKVPLYLQTFKSKPKAIKTG